MNKIGLFQIIYLDQSEWRGYSWCHMLLGTEWTSKFIEDFLFLSVVMSEAFDILDAALNNSLRLWFIFSSRLNTWINDTLLIFIKVHISLVD